MNIGIDARVLMDKYYSGVSRFAYNLLVNLLKIDSNNQYILFYSGIKNAKVGIETENLLNYHLKIPNKILNYGLLKPFSYPKLDVLTKTNVFFLPNINFAPISKAASKVITVHDLSFLRDKSFFSHKNNIWHYMINVKKILKDANTIIAVSQHTKKDIVELCDVDESKVKVIPHGSNNSVLPTRDFSVVAKKYGIQKKYLLMLGNIEPRKNIESSMDSFEKLLKKHKTLREYNLVIAGKVSKKSRKILSHKNKLNFAKQIKFIGYVEEVDKSTMLKNAELLLYPSFYEGYGIPIAESAIVGTPVVASNSTSISEILANNSLLINPYSVSDLLEGIENILFDVSLREKVQNNQNKIFKEELWANTAKKYLEVFSQFH